MKTTDLQRSWAWQWTAALFVLSLSLFGALSFENYAWPLFFWGVFAFMMINYWANEKKQDSIYLFLPWIGIATLMIIFILRLAKYLLAPIFHFNLVENYWSSVLGWPMLISAFALTFYAILLLDYEVRMTVKKRLNSFFSFQRGAVTHTA